MAEENLEIFSLVFFDFVLNDDIEKQFRSIINHMKYFHDIEQCERYIRTLTLFNRIIFIINDKFPIEILISLQKLRQILFIYICSNDIIQDNLSISQYKKIKLIENDLNQLIREIKLDFAKRRILEEPFIMHTLNLNDLNDCSKLKIISDFIYLQVLVYFLLNIKLTNEQIQINKDELINQCKKHYENNLNRLKILNEFQYDYLSSNSLWWYSFDSFLYQLLNKSLLTNNINFIYLSQFFIHDLVRQLKYYQSSTKNERFYRSYLLSNDEFNCFEESIGKYITISTFLSAYIYRNQAIEYFHDISYDDVNMKKVLFKIDVNSILTKLKPFADITIHSQTINDKILFSLGSIFRVNSIYKSKHDYFIINLMLMNDDGDGYIKSVMDFVKCQFVDNDVNLLTFGNILRRFNKLNEAEQCYQRLIDDVTYDQNMKSRSYHNIGRILEMKGNYDGSLFYLHKSLNIKLKMMKPSDPSLGQCYNSIGIVYQELNHHENALEAFNKALLIWKRTYGENHPNIAGCYNNMGVVYKREQKYLKALEAFEKALLIHNNCSIINYHDLAGSHNNIGAVYERLGHHNLAIEHYNLSLKLKMKSVSSRHPSIGSTYENMAYVYENMGAYLQGLSYLEKAARIYRHSLPSTHNDVIKIEQSIQRVASKL